MCISSFKYCGRRWFQGLLYLSVPLKTIRKKYKSKNPPISKQQIILRIQHGLNSKYSMYYLFSSVSFIRLHPETWSTDHNFPVVYSYMSVKAKLNYSCVWWSWELWIWVVYVSNSRFIIFTVFICHSRMHRAYFLFLLWQITFRI